MKGITTLSQLSGQEHGYICHILLGLIIDLCLLNNHSPVHLVRAVCALLDALYISQYPLHSTKTLALLNNAITRFEQNKQVFVDLGICEDFNINKFHFLKHHYMDAIMLYGTTDNYNTEYTERLHIDLAKDAYRASNQKDEYPQMTLWLECHEKISCHEKFIAWRQVGSHQLARPQPPQLMQRPYIQMTKHPSRKGVSLAELHEQYGATHLWAALAKYLVQLSNPNITMSRPQLENATEDFHLPF
jgi:hypothetical protein